MVQPDEEMFDQVLGFFGESSPLAVGEFIAPFLDAREEHILTDSASLSAFPAAVGGAIAIKWRIPNNIKDQQLSQIPRMS